MVRTLLHRKNKSLGVRRRIGPSADVSAGGAIASTASKAVFKKKNGSSSSESNDVCLTILGFGSFFNKMATESCKRFLFFFASYYFL